MKSIVLAICILFFSANLKAQTEQLFIKHSSKGPYVEHKVTPKENFYSIGREFNVHPKHLALFNSLNMSKGLHIGQIIKIPLSDTNYSRKAETGTPVYYLTSNEETIYNVSAGNHVLMEKLRKWNKIASDKLPRGSRLIVGYLNSQEQSTAINDNVQKTETQTKPAPVENEKGIAKNDDTPKQEIKKEEPKTEPKEELRKDSGIVQAKQEEPKKDNEIVQQNKEVKDESTASQKNEDMIPVKEEANTQNSEGGYFKTSFEKQTDQQPVSKEQTVTSGIFKTSSGWADGKYYLLMNGAEPGTIVQVINPSNKKIIYAKLLGEMTDLKQNEGLDIRISNAAAAALNISDTGKFIVRIDY
jgi:LysM repeat protein